MEPLHIEQPSSIIIVHNTLTSNIIHENILTTMENPSPHRDKYFGYTHSSMCVLSSIVFLKKNKKNIKIQDSKMFFTCSTSREKIHYFVKVVIIVLIKVKHQSF